MTEKKIQRIISNWDVDKPEIIDDLMDLIISDPNCLNQIIIFFDMDESETREDRKNEFFSRLFLDPLFNTSIIDKLKESYSNRNLVINITQRLTELPTPPQQLLWYFLNLEWTQEIIGVWFVKQKNPPNNIYMHFKC